MPMDFCRRLPVIIYIFVYITGTDCETQRFREVPKSVLVSENDDVELRCAVEHQKGKAQWTKDGFALGFERDVPGYPRYQYNGDPTIGEHHLIISGVTLQDDGEYQCQVGPTNEAPPIWAAANVTVLVAPSSINIIGWGDGAVVEVVAGSSLALECLVADARPAPSLTWYRDGIELDFSKQRDTLEKGSRPRLMSIRSRLLIRAVPADDGQQFSCRGHHPALDRAPSALVASIALSVLHSPGLPTITGYNEGTVVHSGGKVSLICTSQGGNPRPWVLWYRDGTLVDDTTTLDGSSVVNLMELEVTSNEDNASYECRVTSDMLEEPKSDTITLSVHYSPSSVSVKGPKSVALGDRLNLECETSPSNPQAVVKWMVQGKEVKTDTTVSVKNPPSGWITTSKLSGFKVTSQIVKDGSEVEVTCQAVNPELKDIISQKHSVSLVKPPGPPMLDGVSGEIVGGARVSITCMTKGGNPPPTLTLYKGDALIPSEAKSYNEGTKVIADIKVSADDNGKDIMCQVNHPASKDPISVAQRLTVLFPPSKIIGRASPSAVEEGNHVTLSCVSSSSNPPANISWYSEGSILKDASQSLSDGENNGKGTRSELMFEAQATDDGRIFSCEASNGLLPVASTNISIGVSHAPIWVVRPPDQVDVYESEDLVVSATAAANPGPLRYWWRHDHETLPSTGSELRLTKVRREDQGNYSVNAHSPKGSVNASFFINVQYPPEKVTAVKRFTVGEGGTATIECSAMGNPLPKIIWSRSNRSEPLVTGIQTTHLVIDNANKDDTGIYVCSASNGVGKTVMIESSVIVTHRAIILRDASGSSGSWAVEGGKGLIVCHARASPEPSFHWATLDGQPLQNSHKYKIHDTQLVDGLTLYMSSIEIFDITPIDYSAYRCTTNNALGADTVLMTLRPPDKPHPPSDIKLINKTFSSVTFSWAPSKLEGGPIHSYTIRYGDEENIKFQELTVPPKETETTLYDLEPGSTYVITIYASNDKGSSNFIEPPLLITLPAEPIGSMTNRRNNGGTVSANSKMKSKGGVTIGGWRVPRLVLLITTLTGATLLVLNIAIIACFVRRRNNVRNVSVSSSKTTTYGGLGESSATFESNHGDHDNEDQSRNHSPKSTSQVVTSNRENGSPGSGQVMKVVQMSPPPNGHLPKAGSVVVFSTTKRNHEDGLQVESSRSVDLLQGSVSPEGRRAAAVNPEVCSIASSTYDYQQKRPSSVSCNPLEDNRPYAGDDQLSLSSYHSDYSKAYSYGRPIPNHKNTIDNKAKNGHQVLHPAHIQQVVYQNKSQNNQPPTNVMISKNNSQENHGQYASLNAANLCDLGTNFYDSRCCSRQGSTACDCPSSSHAIGYATLGPRNRRVRAPQFATLQRNRPSQSKLKASSFDSPNCHCGRPSSCQCHGRNPYSNTLPCDPSQPCSLPTCLSPAAVDRQKSDCNGSHKTFGSDEKFRISGSLNQREMRLSQENGLDDIYSMKTLTLRKSNTPKTANNGSVPDKSVTTFKVRPDSPKSIRNLTTRSSSIEIKCSKLSPIHRNNNNDKSHEGLLQSTSFNASPNLTNHSTNKLPPSADSSIKSDTLSSSSSTSSAMTVSYNRPKFPHDYVKQVNGSSGDLSGYESTKTKENNVTTNCVSVSDMKIVR